MNLTPEQVVAMAANLTAIASLFNPAAAATVNGAVQIGSQLYLLLAQIKANDPEMWKRVSADFDVAAAGFRASVAAHPAPKEKPVQ
jgi:hypothetical protein